MASSLVVVGYGVSDFGRRLSHQTKTANRPLHLTSAPEHPACQTPGFVHDPLRCTQRAIGVNVSRLEALWVSSTRSPLLAKMTV